MVVMLPILIMGYPFGPTKKWLSQGFVTILNSAAFMMFMAIMIASYLIVKSTGYHNIDVVAKIFVAATFGLIVFNFKYIPLAT